MDTIWYSGAQLVAERRQQYEEAARIRRVLKSSKRKARRR